MCGIAGIYNLTKKRVDPSTLRKMCDSLKHRGPDDEGYFLKNTETDLQEIRFGKDSKFDIGKNVRFIEEENTGGCDLGLGHRRLSIIDLSSNGHQPMRNENNRIWLVFNGEIYNYLELIPFLESKGHRLTSKTDSEVIIHMYEEKGIGCLNYFNGMFAFALYDDNNKTLFCARDRFGVKPFYYSLNNDEFIFASEIKAIKSAGVNDGENEKTVLRYLHDGSLPSDFETFFNKINELPPAHYMVIGKGISKIERWWELKEEENKDDYNKVVSDFFNIFEDSIRFRLRSDVSLGTCLSGGLDSSSIVSVIKDLLKEGKGNYSQKSFTAVFNEKEFDESSYVNKTVKALGIENYTVTPGTSESSWDEIEKLIGQQDEPFGSLSVFAQWEVMKLAKQTGVTVLLDGQGGDEALAGYHDYYKNYFAGLLSGFHIFKLLKELVLFGQIPASNPFSAFLSAFREAVPFKSNIKGIIGKNYRYAPWIKSEGNFKDLKESRCNFKSSLRKSQAVSIYYYLPGLLRYEDRNSMAHSVEARLPFLDYRLVEFAFSLPDEYKIRDAKTKAVLRDALKGYLVEEVRLRKDKMGFVTPEPVWYKTKLKAKIKDIFKTDDPVSKKYFNKQTLLKLFKEFEDGKLNDFMAIWRIVNCKLWYQLLIEGKQP